MGSSCSVSDERRRKKTCLKKTANNQKILKQHVPNLYLMFVIFHYLIKKKHILKKTAERLAYIYKRKNKTKTKTKKENNNNPKTKNKNKSLSILLFPSLPFFFLFSLYFPFLFPFQVTFILFFFFFCPHFLSFLFCYFGSLLTLVDFCFCFVPLEGSIPSTVVPLVFSWFCQ